DIREEKQRTKIKNKTKAVLLQEIPGLFNSMDMKTGILKMVFPEENGKFAYSQIHCLAVSFRELHEIYCYQYPPDLFKADSRHLYMDHAHKCVRVMDVEGYFREYDLHVNEDRLRLLMEIPEERIPASDTLPAIKEIYTRNAVEQNQYEYYGYYGSGKDEFRKVDSEKNILSVYSYEEPDWAKAFWSCEAKTPVITENGITDLRILYMKQSKEIVCVVSFFDKELHLLREEQISLSEDAFGYPYTYCEETDCIYLGNQKIDLKTREIKYGMKELKEADALFVHRTKNHSCYLYAIKGSYVYVLDMDMNLLSCHRLKGRVMYFYMGDEGNVHLLTTGSHVFEDGKPDQGSAVRLYEIM
ncbi:MAG: hypothetical protein ACI4SA_01630, partial [Lachnospiraceae bacterium]